MRFGWRHIFLLSFSSFSKSGIARIRLLLGMIARGRRKYRPQTSFLWSRYKARHSVPPRISGESLLSPARKPLRYIDVALHQPPCGTSRGGLFDAPALSIFVHACREVHHSRWVS